ncbi:hypothetical protein C8R43DRAFT_1131384 [Mycena crocata]|nr:hypothetical protein C8R43DRAFT_1131384 [Mycena crocata]
MGVWSRLSLIPQLTHLSFNDGEFLGICVFLLQACRILSVLIYLKDDPEVAMQVPEAGFPRDLRFVVMSCPDVRENWDLGINSGVDYWTQAEEFVRSGEIDDSLIPEDWGTYAISAVATLLYELPRTIFRSWYTEMEGIA